MSKRKEERIKEIQKEVVRVQLLAVPGAFFLGLGLYGLFAVENGNAFIEILNSRIISLCFVVCGSIIEIWQFGKVLPLLMEQKKLNEESS